jgi:hypothetical protein
MLQRASRLQRLAARGVEPVFSSLNRGDAVTGWVVPPQLESTWGTAELGRASRGLPFAAQGSGVGLAAALEQHSGVCGVRLHSAKAGSTGKTPRYNQPQGQTSKKEKEPVSMKAQQFRCASPSPAPRTQQWRRLGFGVGTNPASVAVVAAGPRSSA